MRMNQKGCQIPDPLNLWIDEKIAARVIGLPVEILRCLRSVDDGPPFSIDGGVHHYQFRDLTIWHLRSVLFNRHFQGTVDAAIDSELTKAIHEHPKSAISAPLARL